LIFTLKRGIETKTKNFPFPVKHYLQQYQATLTMEHFDDIEIMLLNNRPVENFLGLTPTEVHYLLYDTYGEKSPLQFSNDLDDNTLNQIPIIRIAEEYLQIVQRDKQIKLTPSGALPRKVMFELYDKRILLDEQIESGLVKLWKEQDCISIANARFTAELAGLVRKANGKLTLTKKGAKLIQPENRIQLFKLFFQSFTEKLMWGSNDGYVDKTVGQLGWAFSIYMLIKFGDQAFTTDFYAEKYLKAFPNFITFFEPRFSTPEEQCAHCYGIRTFDRFLLWFGFVTVEKQKQYLDLETDKFLKTDIVNKVFKFED